MHSNCAETSKYWPPTVTSANFKSRRKLRIAMRKYGSAIYNFKTPLELVRAIRDALVGQHLSFFHSGLCSERSSMLPGHYELFKKGILHRDISIHNILLTNLDDICGVLIDLDIAVWTEDGLSPILANPRVVGSSHCCHSSLFLTSLRGHVCIKPSRFWIP